MDDWSSFLFVTAVFAAMLGGLVVVTGALSDWAERDFPPLGRMLDVEGVKLHVVERGQGPPVLFVHGAFTALQDFTNTVLDPVAAHYRAVAIDRPGHGYSARPPGKVTLAAQARLLRGAARSLGLERPILVGFSYGGAVALNYALDYPDDVAGLVLLNPASHEWPDAIAAGYQVASWPVLGNVFVHTLVAPLASLTIPSNSRRAFAPARVPRSFWAAPLPLGLRPASFLANAEDMRQLKDALRALAPRYAALRLPAVVIVSAGNRIVDPDLHARRLCESAPGAELVVLEGAGHPVMYSRPDAVTAAIDRVAAKAGIAQPEPVG